MTLIVGHMEFTCEMQLELYVNLFIIKIATKRKLTILISFFKLETTYLRYHYITFKKRF